MIADSEEALDIVQDAMLRFVRSYTDRPEKEWRPLFFRIVINRARDMQRRRQVTSRRVWMLRQPQPPWGVLLGA
jgi:RNA polymerase sigma-70 factor (ECF subfamily)